MARYAVRGSVTNPLAKIFNIATSRTISSFSAQVTTSSFIIYYPLDRRRFHPLPDPPQYDIQWTGFDRTRLNNLARPIRSLSQPGRHRWRGAEPLERQIISKFLSRVRKWWKLRRWEYNKNRTSPDPFSPLFHRFNRFSLQWPPTNSREYDISRHYWELYNV